MNWNQLFPDEDLINSTPYVLCLESRPYLHHQAIQHKLVVCAFSVWEDGYMCETHGKPVIGWPSGGDDEIIDDCEGRCIERWECFSKESRILTKKLFILSPEISAKYVGKNGGMKRKELKPFLMKELPAPKGFYWNPK